MNARTGMTPDLPAAAAVSAFDRPFAVTLFRDRSAASKHEEHVCLRSLADRVQAATAPSKAELPWLKLARFGDLRSAKGSLRHDANVQAITGIEADYDGGTMPFAEALEVLLKADLLALLYTSPSHTEGNSRWRILCPTSTELPPKERSRLLGRLNGLFRGIFSPESWALSQSYYFGRINSNPSHRVELVDGTPIDLLDEFDTIWQGKSGEAGPGKAPSRAPGARAFDETALLTEIATGAAYHVASVRLLGRWARDGVPYMEARERLLAAYMAVPEKQRDTRWASRRGDVDRCLEDIYGKEAGARDAGQRPGAAHRQRPKPQNEEPWPEPVDFLADNDLTGVPELHPGHLPDALHAFVADTAARMGVDPVAVALAALVTCASVVHEDWRIQPKRHDDTWTEAARIWGAIVGDPSILKTSVIAACTRPVERLELAARKRHDNAMRRYRCELKAWKDNGSNPASMPRQPRLDRYLVEGTTVEALSEVLRDDDDARHRAPAGRVLVRQDEMSEWIASFDRYRSGGRGGSDRGAYLRLYNGGCYVVDRVGRGSFAVPSWSACVLGGIQPEPIQRIAREAADDGLLQRFLYCVPARQEPGEDRLPDRAAIARYEAVVGALASLRPDMAPRGRKPRLEEPQRQSPVVLQVEAHRHREATDDLVRAIGAMLDTSARLKAALGKWHGLFARLCLLFHLIDAVDAAAIEGGQPAPCGEVSQATAGRVAAFMREILLPHLMRAEALMFSSAQTGHARWIAGFVLAHSEARLTLRNVVQAYGPLRAPEARRDLLDVMEGLVAMGWLQPEAQPNPARPPSAWTVNPAVHTMFAVRAEKERARRKAAREQIADTLRRTGRRGA